MTNIEIAEQQIECLCEAKKVIMCNDSKIGEYKCSVPIHFSQMSGMKDISVDTCLQDEIFNLIKKHGVMTIGSCCGHGVKQPFIQVDKYSTTIMEELGYKKLPVDEYGSGEDCYLPKTKL